MTLGVRRGRVAVGQLWLALGLTLACGRRAAAPASSGEGERWLATWEAAPQLTEPRNLPPAPGLEGRTLRQWIHVSVGGTRWRVRLSNEFGDGPLTIDAAHFARTVAADTIDAATNAALTFAGAPRVTIDAGRAVVSDPVELPASALSDLTVTLHVSRMPPSVTGHPGSRTTSYIVTGNQSAARALPDATPVEHWYILSGVDVSARPGSAAVVVLGNSIADGRGSGTNRNNRWPDNLARRLQADSSTRHIAVVNAGIGGNAVVRGGLGPTALARLDRDVLEQSGARWLIVSEGVNDIGNAKGAEESAAVARDLIAAYRAIIRRAKSRGLRVYGATILPFGGSFYASPEHESARQAVNAWVRDAAEFDRVIDFDLALRDPADPTRLIGAADSGDHLHPNELGYRIMADAIDLSLFGRR